MACALVRPVNPAVVAIIVPNDDNLDRVVSSSQDSVERGETRSQLLLAKLKVELNLSHYEMPRAICLTDGARWTPESGLVTGALKIRRKNVEKAYRAEIDKMFAQVPK